MTDLLTRDKARINKPLGQGLAGAAALDTENIVVSEVNFRREIDIAYKQQPSAPFLINHTQDIFQVHLSKCACQCHEHLLSCVGHQANHTVKLHGTKTR